MTKTIAIHTYEPAISSGVQNSSAGGGHWLAHIINLWKREGYDVVWANGIDEDASQFCYEGYGEVWDLNKVAKNADIIFMPWRWEMPNYPERQQKYEDQMWLCSYAAGRIIIHDEDHKLRRVLMAWLRYRLDDRVVFTTPELLPREGFQSLIFPYPFHGVPTPSDLKLKFESRLNSKGEKVIGDFIYVGNNYERYEQTQKFFSVWSDFPYSLDVTFYGNWMEEGPNRESPETVMAALPNVIFAGRAGQDEIMHLMQNEAMATVALHKPSYGQHGFVTIRWAEAVAAGILSFVPEEFDMPYKMKAKMREANLIVSNARGLAASYSAIMQSEDHYLRAMMAQQQLVIQMMNDQQWLDILDKGEKHEAQNTPTL